MTWEYKENVAPIDASEAVKGLWNVHEDEHGNSTLRTHTPRVVWQSCPKNRCYFELTDSPKRECTCRKCGSIVYFVLGIQNLIDGKIVNLR